MKNAVIGGEMIRPPMQSSEVEGMFCAWDPGMVPQLQVVCEEGIEISKLLPPEDTYLGLASNPRGWTEQVLEDAEFQPFDAPLVEQTITMPALERQIFEAGIVPDGSGKVLLSHENTAASGSGPWYLQPTRLRRRIGCSEVEAQDFADICKVLDATELMTCEFCRWARVKGIGPCLEYLRKFVDLENEDPKLNGLDNLNGSAIEGWEFSLTQAGPVIRSDGTMSDLTMWPNPNFTWYWEPPAPEPGTGGAPALDWHIARQYEIDGLEIRETPDPQDQKPDWVSLQPEAFQLMVTQIQESTDIEDLDSLTKYIQNADYLSTTQGRVAHSYIRAARARLEKPSILAQGVIERIRSCSKEKLGSLAKGIFNLVRDGKLKISKTDQRLIWKAYRVAKT